MEGLVEIIAEKGVVFAVAVVAVFLVGYFIKQDREDRREEFKGYRDSLKLMQDEMTKASITTKKASVDSVQTLKLEFNAMRLKLDETTKSVEDLKTQVAKTALNSQVVATQLQERSEKLRVYVDQATEKIGRILEFKDKVDLTHGKVTVLETKMERTDVHHRANMETIAKTIGKHAVEIANLKKDKA